MKKLFISADMEGTAGITHWNETEKNLPDYGYFQRQMTGEVAAAARGAVAGGFTDITVKDAHDSGRNIDPSAMPMEASVLRSWAGHPFSMMYGLTEEYAGVFFTGYHSWASADCNPLAHTMNRRNNYVKINGELASELMINCLTASMLKVPVLMVTGDSGLCAWIKSVNPNIHTVAVNSGVGGSVLGTHPQKAVEMIEQTAREAAISDCGKCMFPMPKSYKIEVNFKETPVAAANRYYPGAELIDSRTVGFETCDYFEVLRFFQFVL